MTAFKTRNRSNLVEHNWPYSVNTFTSEWKTIWGPTLYLVCVKEPGKLAGLAVFWFAVMVQCRHQYLCISVWFYPRCPRRNSSKYSLSFQCFTRSFGSRKTPSPSVALWFLSAQSQAHFHLRARLIMMTTRRQREMNEPHSAKVRTINVEEISVKT